jgi:hypothetical protein
LLKRKRRNEVFYERWKRRFPRIYIRTKKGLH